MNADGYAWEINSQGVVFNVSRIRREKQELIGELSVRCHLKGAQTVEDGILSVADFNFSSVRARQDRARLLAMRARTNGDMDWYGLIEQLSIKVIAAEREGDPSVDLRSLAKPGPEKDFYVDGLAVPRQHPCILFGDGGSCKSYISLYIAGRLVQSGIAVGLFDWELSGEDHRDRLERLFPGDMPQIQYVRCERPLVSEVDRLAGIVRQHNINYAIYDSVAFACNGRPEEAENAGYYFRAVRQIGIGSLHIAHVNKSEDNDKKPFGSSFWANGARSTWFVQASEPNDDKRDLGFFNRKANLGPLRKPFGWTVHFENEHTFFKRCDIADNDEFTGKLTVRQRMESALKRGAKSIVELADEINSKPDTIYKTVQRSTAFVLLEGGRVGLQTLRTV